MNAPRRYSCEDTFRRLDDFLDRELDEAERRLVEEHLATCAQCASEFRFEGSLLSELRAKLRRMEIPDQLKERVLSQLQSLEKGPPR